MLFTKYFTSTGSQSNKMDKLQTLLMLWMFTTCICQVFGNYRRVSVNNVDVCRGSKKKGITNILKQSQDSIAIGEGAAILELKNPSKTLQPSWRNKLKECEIKIKAPEDFGLIAYVEEMSLRRHRKDMDCIDFIQFGQDDILPFYTLKKSRRMCGVKNGKLNSSQGIFYDDPTGNLLIWIGLGGRRRTTNWNEISEVSLTLIITAYKKRCNSNRTMHSKDGYVDYSGVGGKMKKCGEFSDVCILKDYFCDRKFNCPQTSSTSQKEFKTNDELGCKYKNLGLEDTTLSPDDASADDGWVTFGNLNLISLTLIIICLLCVPLILCMAVLQIRKIYSTRGGCCHCFGRNLSERNSCELPEGVPQSLVQLSSQRQRNPNDSEQNVYLPLTTFLDQPISHEFNNATNEVRDTETPPTTSNTATRERRQFTPDFPEGPPPAYNDLFPDGFQQLNESQEITLTEAATISSYPIGVINVGNIPNNDRVISDNVEIETHQDEGVANQSHGELQTSQLDPELLSDPALNTSSSSHAVESPVTSRSDDILFVNLVRN